MAGNFFEIMERLDRRWIYLTVFVALSIPFFIPIPLRIEVMPECRDLHERIEEIKQQNEKDPDNAKIVLISISWSANVQAECWPQNEAIAEHCLQIGLPFAMFSFISPEGPQFGEYCLKSIKKRWEGIKDEDFNSDDKELREKLAPLKRRYDRMGKNWREIQYGVEYVNWGYKYMDIAALMTMISDLYAIFPEDYKCAPLQDFPMMKQVKGFVDCALIVERTGSGTLLTWVMYVTPQSGSDLAFACTGVMAPEAYPYFKSKQIIGLLSGMDGAAQYEKLVGLKARGRKGMESQNLAHLWVILMVILGNLGFLYKRKKDRAASRK
jgi:hypothetical protein